jgi:hypothetical protein
MRRAIAGMSIVRARRGAGKPGARAGHGDQAGQQKAEQREEDDRLIHRDYAPPAVMPALAAGIHVLATRKKGVNGRDEAGHDHV